MDNFTIEHWMIDGLRLKGNELIIFALLYNLLKYNNNCMQVSNVSISKILRLNYKTVFAMIESLVNKEFITKENIYYPNGVRAPNSYTINKEKIRQQCGGLEGLE